MKKEKQRDFAHEVMDVWLAGHFYEQKFSCSFFQERTCFLFLMASENEVGASLARASGGCLADRLQAARPVSRVRGGAAEEREEQCDRLAIRGAA